MNTSADREDLAAVECEGYRAFSGPTVVNLSRLTILFGRNNSGKTTLARLPLFAVASLSDDRDMYLLEAKGLRFGSNFRDLATADQPHPRIRFGVRWNDARKFAVELQHLVVGGRSPRVIPVSCDIDESRITLDLTTINNFDEYSISLLDKGMDEAVYSVWRRRRRSLERLRDSTIHIPSARPRVADVYPLREPSGWTPEEAPYLLARHDSLLAGVGSWFSDALGDPAPDVDRGTFAFRLVSSRSGGGAEVNIADAGRGTQSVLPVVTLLVAVQQDLIRPRLLIVEEPEAHLHPSAHGEVADLLLACSERCQVVVETHSENLILRLRRRIAERRVSNQDIALDYIDPEYGVHKIEIDEAGFAPDWPAGVFEDDIVEASAIVQARLGSLDRGNDA